MCLDFMVTALFVAVWLTVLVGVAAKAVYDTVPAINELEQRLLDTLQAQQAAMLANSMAEAIARRML